MKSEDKEAENIRVAVRCRPMNERENREKAVSCFTCDNGNAILTNLENPSEKHQFAYDFVYGSDSAQQQVFQDIGVPILDRAFGGYNGTIFAYGQTGSGKSFSMSGVSGSETLEGLIPRMNKAIFDRIKADMLENPHKLYLVECSFFEIYNEIIYDLLDLSGNGKKNKGGLEIKEHSVLGIYVKDLQERVVESRDQVIELMAQGAQARTVGYTQMNAESSRSHSIFVIKIHQKDSTDESKNIFAKINLVDLAGSERAASTGAQGDRLKEGANINKSLSALGNVINALVEASRTGKKVFIPYRNSKLTRVLQESLGGNSLCSMLATLSPANINFPETLSTLKYASRAKSIKVNAKKNEASSQISQLNDEIAVLKKKLQEQTSTSLGLDPKEKEEIITQYEKQIQEMDRVRLQTWEDKAKQSKQHELERKKLAREKALADQKIREERTRKWKLLEDKEDIELMVRALRDLGVSITKPQDSTEKQHLLEETWLASAHKMKLMENESKDHRTMIMVFKDALTKDVEHLSQKLKLDDGKVSDAATVNHKRDDSAAIHMTSSQVCSKLQNIHQESTQLMTLENQLILEQGRLVNDMMSELIRLKEYRATKKVKRVQETSTSTATNSSKTQAITAKEKEEDQMMEERENGLSMTLAMVKNRRSQLVVSIKTERKRIFDVSNIAAQFLKYTDIQIASSQENSSTRKDWASAKSALQTSLLNWESTEKIPDKSEQTPQPESFEPSGDVVPLGLESCMISDECLTTSSKVTDAKFTRMNTSQCWIPDEQDKTPFLTVDVELPRIFHSFSIRGGQLNGKGLLKNRGLSGDNKNSETGRPGTASRQQDSPPTFVLKPPSDMKDTMSKFKVDSVSGEHEQTYEILSHVMSWVDLLKTSVLPAKLFARPPVRFIHDVVSMIISNTGYCGDLFSQSEKDYTQLVSKTDRADYLTKILDFVQEHYKTHHELIGASGPCVIIAATASNILAGKEAADTLKFLSYFAIAAMEYTVENPRIIKVIDAVPGAEVKSVDLLPAIQNEAIPAVNAEQEQLKSVSEVQVAEPVEETSENNVRDCWVKKVQVMTSFNGQDWLDFGEYEACCNHDTLQTITIQAKSGASAAGRFFKLVCLEWQILPLFQIELFGQDAKEGNELAKSMEVMASKAIALLDQLLSTSARLLQDAKSSWDQAKTIERQKQEALTQSVEEIAKLKQQKVTSENDIKELQLQIERLQGNLQIEKKSVSDERAKSEKLHTELQQSSKTITEMKAQTEKLEAKINEQVHALNTITLQHSEQKKTVESLQRSKQDLETLCSNLRIQLESRNKQEGHQESKMATLLGDVMTLNVQVEEFKRKFETSEQMRQEQEAFGQQLHIQLQDSRAMLNDKDKVMQEALSKQHQETSSTINSLNVEKQQLKQQVDQLVQHETVLKNDKKQLQTQLETMVADIDIWKAKLKAAEENVAATMAESESTRTSMSGAAANAENNERLLLEAQTKELRYLAEVENLDSKVQVCEQKLNEAELKWSEAEKERQVLAHRISELEELEEEMQLQLQVVTEERDSARQKEEQLFTENNEKEQEIERIRDGYGKNIVCVRILTCKNSIFYCWMIVWVTDRMNSKEDELSELQEQLEKYQSLLEITAGAQLQRGKKNSHENGSGDEADLKKLYALAIGTSYTP